MSKTCLTCGGLHPNDCICKAKGKMPVWIEVEILLPKKWLETLVKMSEGELSNLDLIKLQGFAQSAKSILKHG